MSLFELITGLSIIFAGNSYHFDRNNTYNEENHLRGIELHLKDYDIGFKKFTNSYERPSNSLTLTWKKKYGNFGIGFGGGIATNYPDNKGVFVSPVVSYKIGSFEIDLNCMHTLCFYQLKWQVKL